MLRLAAIFLVIAIIAAAVGFGDVVSRTTVAAKIVFTVFLLLFIGSLIVASWLIKHRD